VEFKLRCERRLGDLLRQMKDAGEMKHGGHNKKQSSPPATLLPDLGLSRKLSSRAQLIARVPEADFEAADPVTVVVTVRSRLWSRSVGAPCRK
jgi:hypothetical protein